MKELTTKQYNVIIGLVLLWGFIVNIATCVFFSELISSWSLITVLIVYIIMALTGASVGIKSDNPILNFLGYNLIVVPLGAVLSIFLRDYNTASIVQTIATAALLTLLMILISSIKPQIFNSLGTTLLICLTCVIVVEFLMLFIGISSPYWWDKIVSLLFCMFIGFDWSKSQERRKTASNAIISAISLYLDIINLFLRLFGNEKRCDK